MSEWITVNCERALYVDRGRDVIACDRLSSNVTMLLKVAAAEIETMRQQLAEMAAKAKL